VPYRHVKVLDQAETGNRKNLWRIKHGDAGKVRNYPILAYLPDKFARFLYEFMLFDLKASTFRPYPQTEATLMSMKHLMTSRYNTCNNWACSAGTLALHLYTQGPGFEPGFSLAANVSKHQDNCCNIYSFLLSVFNWIFRAVLFSQQSDKEHSPTQVNCFHWCCHAHCRSQSCRMVDKQVGSSCNWLQ
jgi:hypothetical protein